MSLPFAKVKEEALSRAKTLIPALLPGGRWQGAEWVAINPKRKDSKAGSLSINSATGIWKDFASGDGGADLISLHAWVHGMGQGEACKVLAADFGIKTDGQAEPKDEPAPRYPRPILPVPEGVPALAQRKGEEGRWEYRDAEGRLLFLRVRTPDPAKGKAVITWTWCETGPGMAEWRPKAPDKPWPVYGLDRLARNPEARVLVVEGEKTADAAERIFPGMVAVTSGSVDSAASAGWEALAGREVWIWRDADEAGLKYQYKVAELLLGVTKTVRQVALPDAITAWRKPGKNKPGGWDLADPAPAGVDLQAILDGAKAAGQGPGATPKQCCKPQEWPEAQPLYLQVESQPYPIDALPNVIRAAVQEVQGFVQAPVPLVASSALAALSLATQTHWDMKRADTLSGPVSLFLLTIADSGERKSTCDGFFTKVLRAYEVQQAEIAKPLLKDFQAALGAWEEKKNGLKDALRSEAKKGNDTQAIEEVLRDLEHQKPDAPLVPKLIYADATPEQLKWSLAKIWPSGAVLSSEGGIVFGACGMRGESLMMHLATLDLLWDGADITTDRRTSDSFVLRGARLSIAIQVQEPVLRAFFKNSGDLPRAAGFLARCLIAWPESTQGLRFFTDPPVSWPYLGAFNRRIDALLKLQAPIDENGALHPAELVFTPEAKAEWAAFHDRVERDLPSGERLHEIRDVASKIADNAARIAALFHAFKGDPGNAVGLDSFRSAVAIAEWHLNEAKRFLGGLALPAGLVDAARLESWLIARCKKIGSNTVPTHDIQQFGPSGLREKAKIEIALGELVELGRAQSTVEGRRKFIALNPSILSPVEPATAISATFATDGVKEVQNHGNSSRNSRNSSSNPAAPNDRIPFRPVSGETFEKDI